jgi:hypothetical protein
MASAPCHILELYPRPCCSSLQTQLVIAMINAAWDGLRWQVICVGTNFVPTYSVVAKRIPYDARMVRVSAWRHAMLFNGPCPFQAAGRHARCAGCGTVIRATVEDKYRVVLFADMLVAAPCPDGACCRICGPPCSLQQACTRAVQPLTVVGGDARERRRDRVERGGGGT